MNRARVRISLLRGERLDEWWLDFVILALAGWTLACHLAVQLGAGFDDLVRWSAGGALPLGVALLLSWRPRAPVPAAERATERAASPAPPPAPPFASPFASLFGSGIAAAALAVGGTLVLSSGARVTLVWWVLVLAFAAGWVTFLRAGEPTQPRPDSPRLANLALLALALGCGAFALTVHAVSPDDPFYVNIAVGALDRPHLPLLRYDTLHGVPNAPILYWVYRVHSHELLVALASLGARPFGWSVMQVAHLVLPALFAVLAVLSAARLLLRLAPRTWLLSTFVLVALLVLVTETPVFYGPFSFLRLQQGKSVFLAVLVPAIVLYGLRFGERPSWHTGIRLAGAQIASVGMTGTALWCAPALGGLALIAGASGRRGGARHVLLGLAALAYPLALGVALRSVSLEEIARISGEGVRLNRLAAEPLYGGAAVVRGAWQLVHGNGPFSAACLLATLVAGWIAPSRDARAVALVFPLGVLLVLMNPYTALEVARSVTGEITYWRVLWVLPVPLFLTLVLCAPASLSAGSPVRGRLAAVILAAACIGLLPERHVDHPANRSRVELFGLKRHPADQKHAKTLVRQSPPRSHVLAAFGVGPTVAMIEDHPWPLVVRRAYIEPLAEQLGEREIDERLRLYDYVSGKARSSERELLGRALQRYPLVGVTFTRAGPHAAEIREVLAAGGMRPVLRSPPYETWAIPRQR